MKTFLVFILLCTFSISFAQEISGNIETEKYFIATSFRSNITGASNLGMGLKLSLGYNINDDFHDHISVIFPSSFINRR